MGERVRVVEVGPRDGLQNEKVFVPTKDKIRLVDMLTQCGIQSIEVTSFVSPKWVPQLADAEDVMAGISRSPHAVYSALVPNRLGFERANAAGEIGRASCRERV